VLTILVLVMSACSDSDDDASSSTTAAGNGSTTSTSGAPPGGIIDVERLEWSPVGPPDDATLAELGTILGESGATYLMPTPIPGQDDPSGTRVDVAATIYDDHTEVATSAIQNRGTDVIITVTYGAVDAACASDEAWVDITVRGSDGCLFEAEIGRISLIEWAEAGVVYQVESRTGADWTPQDSLAWLEEWTLLDLSA
jgi:hypothetical protein